MECNMRNSIGFQLKKTKGIMDREFNKYLKPYGVSVDQGSIMKYIHESPGCSQTILAEDLYKDKTTITRMIDTLVKKELVIRKPDKNDRRSICLYLTKEGTAGIEALDPIIQKHLAELNMRISREDEEVSMRVLKTIEEYFKGLN